MSMDKRWNELFTRLEAVEAELKELREAIEMEPAEVTLEATFEVTKEELMSIKGVGESTADAILELLNG